jgi:hypothetical protein
MKIIIALLIISSFVASVCVAEYDAVECSSGKTPKQLSGGSWTCVADTGEGNVVYPKGRNIERFYE